MPVHVINRYNKANILHKQLNLLFKYLTNLTKSVATIANNTISRTLNPGILVLLVHSTQPNYLMQIALIISICIRQWSMY